MAKSTDASNDILNYTFNGVAPSWAAAGNLYVALHTAAPSGSAQTSNEIAFTGYARQAVARTGSGWTLDTVNSRVSNAAAVSFPINTGTSATATHVSVGTDLSGTGKILYSGALDASKTIPAGVIAQFIIAALKLQET